MKLGLLTRSLPEFLFGKTDNLDDLDEQARRRVRAAQISAVVQLVPLTMTVNILNACVIVYVFWNTGYNSFLTETIRYVISLHNCLNITGTGSRT